MQGSRGQAGAGCREGQAGYSQGQEQEEVQRYVAGR